MLGLFKSNQAPAPANYFPIRRDMHSHILPGIDDGSPDVETSISLINGLKSLGLTGSIATPHIIGDLYRNNRETISIALEKLRAELSTRGIAYELHAAAEYMLDGYFLDLLASGEQLLRVKDNMILTEFSYAERPHNPEQFAFEIITGGYAPILAHPERYFYFHQDMAVYNRLHDLGFQLQINLLSLTGHYGKNVAKAAQYMLKHDLVAFVGTDLHHAGQMEMLKNNRQVFFECLGGREWNEQLSP